MPTKLLVREITLLQCPFRIFPKLRFAKLLQKDNKGNSLFDLCS